MSKFHKGDKLKVTSQECGNVTNPAYIIIDRVKPDGGYAYTGYDTDGNRIGECHGCYNDDNLEPFNGDTTVNKKRTFKLLKETPALKVGALLQEECEDGTQPYSLINADTHSKDPSQTVRFPKRELIEEQPKFFIEVFQVNPQYMTQVELDQYESFKNTLKQPKKVAKAQKKSKTTK